MNFFSKDRARQRFIVAALLSGVATAASAQTPDPADAYLRYPDVCGSRIVFSFAGDLWLQDGAAVEARRLTSTPGPEYFAKFSPDCKMLAFTARIDGDDQAYVMPADGGEARRLTSAPSRKGLSTRWGSDNQVVGWTPDGSAILIRSMRDAAMLSQSNLYTVSLATRTIEPAGTARAGAGVFSPDGTQILYSPWSRDFRTWKHYRGGWAQDLWIYDRSSGAARQLTRTDATERDPMWTRQGLFFLSDRNGAMNLFRADPATGEAEQLTRHESDAKWASADRAGAIVYEVDGRIWRFDPATGASEQQVIRVSSDALQARPRFARYGEAIDSFVPTPDGDRALFVARGDIFDLAAGDAPVRAVTASSDAQEREAAMSSDGKWIAYVSDRGGEEELWIASADGGAARQLTSGHHDRFSRPQWAPDGKRIALSGKDGAIYLVDVASGAMREAGRSGSVFVNDYAWSPNSRYLAYTRFGPADMGQVQILDVAIGKTVAASDPLYNMSQPAFSPDGNYLYALTDRQFRGRFEGREWNFQVPRQRSIAILPLRAGLPDPFLTASKDETVPPLATIDFDGLIDRLAPTPIASANIDAFTVGKDDIVYSAAIADDDAYRLSAYSFEKKDTRTVADRVDAVAFLPWSASAVTRREKDYALLDTASGKARKLDIGRLTGTIAPREEWRAVFDEVCRRYRDFFYDAKMHGFDWAALCARYRADLPRIGSRGDLTEVIGRMVSELNVGHAYIDGRDEWQPATPGSAALGAVWVFDAAKARWRISHIYAGDPVDPLYRSPLGALGKDVRVGDWLLAIDGRALDARTDPLEALIGKADKEVALTIGRDGVKGERTLVVKPIASQEGLAYREWSENNRHLVDRVSGGRIGYVHIPAMSPQGLAEFARGYFGQIRKDGLIVDIRGNLGGSGSPLVIDRLLRPFLTTGHVKGMDYPTTYPWGGFTQVFTGKLALLVNEATMSDGDTMAYEWRQAKLGPIYGKRTWGGVIGTGSTGPLLDGTETNVPQYALAATDGSWIVEGEGVKPDVEIGFDADAKLGGDDPQLAEAARLLATQISGHPGTLPNASPGPDKRDVQSVTGTRD